MESRVLRSTYVSQLRDFAKTNRGYRHLQLLVQVRSMFKLDRPKFLH